jgi:predicted extracellular nuclease
VLGDLNAYRHEAPIERFAAAGWWLAVDAMPAERAYSYVHFGLAGALDHAAADPELAPRLAGAGFWAINADEPRGAAARANNPFRSSDHDPLLLGLD